MKNYLKHLLLFFTLVAVHGLMAQQAQTSATFVPNRGQWQGDFDYRLETSKGAFFFEKSGYTAAFVNLPHHHSHDDHSKHPDLKGVAYQMTWLNGTSSRVSYRESERVNYRVNYLKGNNPQHWLRDYKPAQKLRQSEIYPGIEAVYRGKGKDLKYDLVIDPGAQPEHIKMQYKGLQNIALKNGSLHLTTEMGTLTESIPLAYQNKNGKRVKVSCKYRLEGNVVSFALGNYDENLPLIIDPILVFSTFSGSGDNNFGFTATYGEDGSAYGGGVNYGPNYPTTLGAFQDTFGGIATTDVDVSISKFNESGTQLIYATYLGGKSVDVPHSIIEDDNGNLIILGNTGSQNFPVSRDAYIDSFMGGPVTSSATFTDYKQGTDIFITKLNSDGTGLEASTFWGGSHNDGVNQSIYYNYGDQARGEVILTDGGDIAIVGSSYSTDIQTPGSNFTKTDSSQEAIVGVFDETLTNVKWASYLGGSNDDCGYSLKNYKQHLFVTGSTMSSDMAGGTYADLYHGSVDGYLARFNVNTGILENFQFFGSLKVDQSFILDIDKDGHPYVLGQTLGDIPISPGVYGNPNSQQFIMKFDTSGSTIEWQTQIGSGKDKSDLVPTAFMIDRCYNIYLSGWNGQSNRITPTARPGGNTNGLPTSGDAYKGTTDGSDFYFMVLNKDASSMLYATYFGGNDNEHVDGGTSRFSPEGVIYQSVCANCQGLGFPTTPGTYSPNSGYSSCNMSVFKMDFEKIVTAKAAIDYETTTDTICNALMVKFNNNSINANEFKWNFDNGETSTDSEPSVTFKNLGEYNVTLVAFDTICGITDTLNITINHDSIQKPRSEFETNYRACDAEHRLELTNKSTKASQYLWDFGDGSFSNQKNPSHTYQNDGTYQVELIAIDTVCQNSDTTVSTIEFNDTIPSPEASVSASECSNGLFDVDLDNDRPWYQYSWSLENQSARLGPNPILRVEQPGNYTVTMEVTDTLCNKMYADTFRVNIETIISETFIPDAFSPNGDGLNETFKLYGDRCGEGDYIQIYNRWGELIFETDQPYEVFWEGYGRNGEAPQGVYNYILKSGENVRRGSFTLIR